MFVSHDMLNRFLFNLAVVKLRKSGRSVNPSDCLAVAVVCRDLHNFTRCMECDVTDARFPIHSVYYDYGTYQMNTLLTPLRLRTLCRISTQRKPFLSALF